MFRTVAQLGRRLRYAGTFYFTRNKIFPNFPKTEAIKRYLSAAYCESFRVPNNSSTKKAARQGFFFFFAACCCHWRPRPPPPESFACSRLS